MLRKYNIKFYQVFIVMAICIGLIACQNSEKKASIENEKQNSMDGENLRPLLSDLSAKYETLRPKVIQPAEGYLKYPYLIPAGFYKQMWDWDGFFMGNHFVSKGKPEYLKFWALNLIQGIDDEGYVSGGATTEGPRFLFGKFAVKPFLSQGVYFACEGANDYEWIASHYEELKKVLAYRERTQQDSLTGLFFWDNGMQSGADNNAALNYFTEDKRTFLAPDASTLQCREYLAQAAIAKKLGEMEDAKMYAEKAERLKLAINKHLWSDEDKIYYTVDRETRKFYKRVSYSSFLPLIENIPSPAMGKEMISKYLINPDHMKAKYGYRTLSIQDPDYNNKNIILPFSNWQGPVWPIANFIYSIGLKKYGFSDELYWQAETLGTLLLKDIEKNNTMHENYHADTGVPLAPSDDHVDENGNIVGFISWNLCIENLLDGVVNDNWMLLEIK
ncbi:MGH1-like glycoside hydrolase domain-containing protein [Aureibaculum flavum]|nr:trehalase family glycosidase [Aureibaculum flavum]